MLDVSKAVIKKDDAYLLIKRSSNTLSYPGLWDFPGGKLEHAETPEQAVVREVYEEVSYEIEPGSEIGREEYHDEFHDVIFHFFTPTSFRGEIGLSKEHTDCMWVKRENIWDYNVTPSVRIFFMKYKY